MKPNEQAAAARRRRRKLLGVFGVAALAVLSVGIFKGLGDLKLGQAHVTELEQELGEGEQRIEALERQIAGLEEDSATLERLAREDLLMARPDDVVILVQEGLAAESATNDNGEGDS